MNEPKYTPGPWEFVAKLSASENHKGYFIRAQKASRDGKWALAEVQPADEGGAVGGANARLIAAAPDLLIALRNLELGANTVGGCLSRNPANFAAALRDLSEYADKARAVLAKATGIHHE